MDADAGLFERGDPVAVTQGLGSCMATCASATPAATMASAHGGVRPKWAHGSSVT